MTWLAHHTTFFIYALLEDDGRARYIGATVSPEQRRYKHYVVSRQCYRGDTPLRRWLEARWGAGLPLHMLLLEKVDGSSRVAREREAYWMDLYRRLGCELLNTASVPKQDCLW